MRFCLKLALGACGLFGSAALAWMMFLPWFAERELSAATGFDVRLEVLAANPFSGHLVVRGLRARNPTGYPKPEFVELRTLVADVGGFSWIGSGRLVVDHLDIDVTKLELVLRKDGKSNAAQFVAALGGPPSPPGRGFHYLIRHLHLKIDELTVADYSTVIADERTYHLAIDQSFTDVSDTRQLLVPEFTHAFLAPGAHVEFGKLLPGGFGAELDNALGRTATIGVQGIKKAEGFLKGLFDKLEQTPKP